MFKIIKIIAGYCLIIVFTAVLLILGSLLIGRLLNWFLPSIDFGIASILSLISLICGAKMVYFFSGLQNSIDDRFENLEELDESDEDERSEIIYVNPTFINRKRRKPRRR